MDANFCLIFIMVSAKWCAPPSARSGEWVRSNSGVETKSKATITVHARQHDVAQSPTADGFCGVFRLVRVQRRGRLGSLDGTEPAASCARVAHELRHPLGSARGEFRLSGSTHHDGGSRGPSSLRLSRTLLSTPAVPNIRTSCFLADGVQV